MISVEEAAARILAAIEPLESERVPLEEAADRALAEDAVALFDQPPFPVSAMDGYAVRAADIRAAPATLTVTGSAPAGHPFGGSVNAGEAVRVFTGSVVPDGADTVVIQEDTEQSGGRVSVKAPAPPGRHVRAAGLDFGRRDVLAHAGTRLRPRDLALLAAGDVAEVSVKRRPRVLLVATGDELSLAGAPRKPGGIVASSLYAVSALIGKWGGCVRNLGILPDTLDAVSAIAAHAQDSDLIVTLGGASVGEHDLIQRALAPTGFKLDFWRIAMRPGKPLIFGRLADTPLLGLPGNPVSSYVCALLFLKPALLALQGVACLPGTQTVRLAGALPSNDNRQDYLRARLFQRDGEAWAEPFPMQDSSMQRLLAKAGVLIVRAPHARAAEHGAMVQAIRLELE